MKVPPGMTVAIGRKVYGQGEELPANAPEAQIKRCQARAAEIAKKAKADEKPITSTVTVSPANTGDKTGEGGGAK
jgi:hypothetical protein